MVAQENVLFSASLRENITCDKPEPHNTTTCPPWLKTLLPVPVVLLPVPIVSTGRNGCAAVCLSDGMGANGLPAATDEMVAAACEAANCSEFIKEVKDPPISHESCNSAPVLSTLPLCP